MRFEPQSNTQARLAVVIHGSDGKPVDPTTPVTPENFVLHSDGAAASPGEFCTVEWIGGGFGWLVVDNSADDVFFAEGSLLKARVVNVEVEGDAGYGDWLDDQYVVGEYPTEFKPVGANTLTIHATFEGEDVAGVNFHIRSAGYRRLVSTDLHGDAEKDLAPALYRITVVSDVYNTQVFDDVDLSSDQHLEVTLTMPTIPQPTADGNVVAYTILRRHGVAQVGVTLYLREKMPGTAGLLADTTPIPKVTDSDGLAAWPSCDPNTTYVLTPPYGEEIEFTTGLETPHAIPPGRFFQNSA